RAGHHSALKAVSPVRKANELRARDKRPYTSTCARSFSFSWQLLLYFDLSCKPPEMLKELSCSDAGEYNPSAHYSCEPSGDCFQSAHQFGHLRIGYVPVYNSRACYFGCDTLTACLMTR